MLETHRRGSADQNLIIRLTILNRHAGHSISPTAISVLTKYYSWPEHHWSGVYRVICDNPTVANGYVPSFAAGTLAAGGTPGIMIPPSIALLLHTLITEHSVGQMFMASIIPGLLVLALYYFTTIAASVFFKPSVAVVYPIIIAAGFDPIWFGLLTVITVELGLITPPVGMKAFVIKSVAGLCLVIITARHKKLAPKERNRTCQSRVLMLPILVMLNCSPTSSKKAWTFSSMSMA
ncbi:MAG: TRAP transporter large permease subunit [Rhodospirillales bacterium]|nr:TRAP transporter large permease subunit [Rhodospirillales bacterium]